ncbi:MAG TPA: helix-turn-helix transcriptional regulator [Saprospiraceae bacterium]|nr:helix-turn-helix transcriptional regulator [Saprospiraceae bacterium]
MKIQHLRKLKGINQAEIAEKLSISQSAYAKIEADVTKMDVDRLKQICDILEVDISELIGSDNGRSFVFSNNKNITNGYVETLHQCIKEQHEAQIEQIIRQHNQHIASLNEEIAFLRTLVGK